MTTGSLCLTEILKSWKSCSSKSEASHFADSTSASGVALPYFSSSRGSSDPALTPIRIEVPRSFAARAICLTWSSNLRMLPGLTRTAAQPASMAAKTYFGWKWMSAMTGICDFCAIAGSASASSARGQATRTMSQPEAVSSAICWSVELMSEVSVVVIDCTETGASPPTSTFPTLIWRVLRRGASTGGGAEGMPRLIAVTWSGYSDAASRRAGEPTYTSMGTTMSAVMRTRPITSNETAHDVGDRQQLGDVDEPGVGPAAHPRHAAPQRPRRARRRCGRRRAAAAG